jgi:hypothetical protein
MIVALQQAGLRSPIHSISVTTASLSCKIVDMSTVTEIIEAVKSLGLEEKGEFLTRLSEVDFDDAWDRQMTADAESGKLDTFWEQALEDIKAGRTKPLDEVLNDA